MTVYTLTAELQRTMPDRIKSLPRDALNRPIPWFAQRGSKTADYRSSQRVEHALQHNLCWTCGQRLGRNKAFVTGTAGAIWRNSLEPPSHRSCAVWVACACPHFARPRRVEVTEPVEELEHAPGVCCVWVTRSFRAVEIEGDTHFRLSEPIEVTWLHRGMRASRRTVVSATDKTLRLLIEIAQDESEEAVLALLQAVARMRQYLPGAKDDGEPGTAPPTTPASSASAA